MENKETICDSCTVDRKDCPRSPNDTMRRNNSDCIIWCKKYKQRPFDSWGE